MAALPPILRILRPGDWTKNAFVLLPFGFWAASSLRQGADAAPWELVARGTALAFAAFCLAASGWYCVNDALDAEEDRAHPVKCRRPVASGAVSRGTALTLGVVLIAAALGIASLASRSALVVLATYVVLQLAYNVRLKRTVYVDVASIAAGFCLRAVAGAVAGGIPVSAWLIICTFFLTLFLGLVKRLCDMSGAEGWRQRAGYGDPRELDWLLGVAATVTLLAYLMYTTSSHAAGLYGVRAYGLAFLSPLVLLALQRFHRRALQGLSDSPLAALREDPWIRVAILGWVVGAGAVLFWGPVEPVLSKLLT